ncbi:hypothetical protein CR205_08510 [Alteribacter lacisalsi]|uniref:Prepilin-type N-terminal cleavage/methylation domain-containing protein n=1 Tax=Alteribacter lacisalsi TaxID=2045244 RepID=A0A2W0HXV0_9BACI|nr:competence type IV pilus minor pilin ComGD [Alteribacter lacisalsi]PYZ98608.1 hypothetical protein CR205_08510 [Alteribacter lacisalsi]
MTDEKGYTLIEMLIVLSLLSVLLLIAIPKLIPPEVLESEQFLTTLKSDLYNSQIRALATQTPVQIIFDNINHKYIIRQDLTVIAENHFPAHLRFEARSLGTHDLRFMSNGNIQRSGSFVFSYERGGGYRVVFPFIRGRFYVEEF